MGIVPLLLFAVLAAALVCAISHPTQGVPTGTSPTASICTAPTPAPWPPALHGLRVRAAASRLLRRSRDSQRRRLGGELPETSGPGQCPDGPDGADRRLSAHRAALSRGSLRSPGPPDAPGLHDAANLLPETFAAPLLMSAAILASRRTTAAVGGVAAAAAVAFKLAFVLPAVALLVAAAHRRRYLAGLLIAVVVLTGVFLAAFAGSLLDEVVTAQREVGLTSLSFIWARSSRRPGTSCRLWSRPLRPGSCAGVRRIPHSSARSCWPLWGPWRCSSRSSSTAPTSTSPSSSSRPCSRSARRVSPGPGSRGP